MGELDRIVIINDLSNAAGGASAIAIEAAKSALTKGVRVTLIVGDDGANPELSDLGMEIVAFGGKRLLSTSASKALVGGLYNHSARRLIEGWIKQNDTPQTIYHLHGWAQILSPAVFAAVHSVRRRLLISAHDFFLVCPSGAFSFPKTGAVCGFRPLSASCISANCDRRSYGHKLWRVARQLVQRLYYQPSRSATVLPVHPAMSPFLTRSGVPQSAILPLRNPARPFAQTPIDPAAGDEFLFVGRLEHSKGPDLALAAARLAGAKLRVIGDGVMRPVLQDQYPEMIFMGRLSHEAIGKWCSQARALIMPSRYPEPFGLVLIEAMWSGLPVIVCDQAFLAPEIARAGAGLSCNVFDVQATAAAILALLEDPDLARRMGRRARSATKDLAMTPEAWSEALIGVYRQTAGVGV